MIAERPVRAICLAICIVLLSLPAVQQHRAAPDWSVMGIASAAFPVWLFLFGFLCIKEGEQRGRERERRRQGAGVDRGSGDELGDEGFGEAAGAFVGGADLGFEAVAEGHEVVDLGDDARLLGEGRHWDKERAALS